VAIYRVWSGGDGTGGADNTNWAQAYTTLALAIAVPPTAGDKIYISHVTQENIGVDTFWIPPANVDIIAVNKDSSETPTAMGTGGWIGTSSGAFVAEFVAGNGTYVYGLTVRNGGVSNDRVTMATNTGGCQVLFDECKLWMGTTSSLPEMFIGSKGLDRGLSVEYRNFTVRFGNTSQFITIAGQIFWNGGGVDSAGSAPTTLFGSVDSDPGSVKFQFSGLDLTHISGTLVIGTITSRAPEFRFSQCKLNSAVTPVGTYTATTKGSPQVWLLDCSDNAGTPKRGIWAYYDALGTLERENTIYRTDGATGWSWKITGTANATYENPFVTPWLEYENAVNTSITPRFEVFRDGSTTAYTDAQIWAEWAYKQTSGSDQATFTFGDRQSLAAFLAGTAGSSQATGSGTGDWATGTGADWSGKVDSGSAITCAEDGIFRGRVAVTGAITLYVHPPIRT